MTTITDRDLAELLQRNPHLGIVTDGEGYTTVEPVKQKGKAATPPEQVTWTEHEFQAAVIAECDRRALTQPEYGMIFSIPNGQYRKGQRMEAGLKSGLPDLFLPVPSGQQNGLFVELKVKDGKPSRAQMEWIRRLRIHGYRCEIVWDHVTDVMSIIDEYLDATT